LVIDEADLILSYGHDEDIRRIFADGFLPKVYQSFLMSATMTDDVETLKGLVLRNPVSTVDFRFFILVSQILQAILKLEEDEDEAAHLSQYSVRYVKDAYSSHHFDPTSFTDAPKSTNFFLPMLSSSSD
jgi:ATP-dependent RNA helicase DDX56/DBP9